MLKPEVIRIQTEEQMTDVFWPWDPSDEEIILILALHRDAQVIPYDGQLLQDEELTLLCLVADNPDAIVYAPAVAVPILAAALAGKSFRIIEQNEFAQIVHIYRFDPNATTKIEKIWPKTSLEDLRKRIPEPH